MKISKILVLLALFSLIFCQSLAAMTIGKNGGSFLHQKVQWQPMKYDNGDAGFVAALPGEPSAGTMNSIAFVHSEYNGVAYQVNTDMSLHVPPFESETAFIKHLENEIGSKAKIISIPSTQKEVKYIAELQFRTVDQIVRLYWAANNRIYFAIVLGKDQKLAPFFFSTVKITK